MKVQYLSPPRLLPWRSWDEFAHVCELLESNQTNSASAGSRKELLHILRSWNSKGRLPVAVSSTLSLLESFESGNNNNNTAASQLAAALAVTRFVNAMADLSQTRQYAASIADLMRKLSVARWLVDVRHEAAHGPLPSTLVLQLAASYVLGFAQTHYWTPQQMTAGITGTRELTQFWKHYLEIELQPDVEEEEAEEDQDQDEEGDEEHADEDEDGNDNATEYNRGKDKKNRRHDRSRGNASIAVGQKRGRIPQGNRPPSRRTAVSFKSSTASSTAATKIPPTPAVSLRSQSEAEFAKAMHVVIVQANPSLVGVDTVPRNKKTSKNASEKAAVNIGANYNRSLNISGGGGGYGYHNNNNNNRSSSYNHYSHHYMSAPYAIPSLPIPRIPAWHTSLYHRLATPLPEQLSSALLHFLSKSQQNNNNNNTLSGHFYSSPDNETRRQLISSLLDIVFPADANKRQRESALKLFTSSITVLHLSWKCTTLQIISEIISRLRNLITKRAGFHDDNEEKVVKTDVIDSLHLSYMLIGYFTSAQWWSCDKNGLPEKANTTTTRSDTNMNKGRGAHVATSNTKARVTTSALGGRKSSRHKSQDEERNHDSQDASTDAISPAHLWGLVEEPSAGSSSRHHNQRQRKQHIQVGDATKLTVDPSAEVLGQKTSIVVTVDTDLCVIEELLAAAHIASNMLHSLKDGNGSAVHTASTTTTATTIHSEREACIAACESVLKRTDACGLTPFLHNSSGSINRNRAIYATRSTTIAAAVSAVSPTPPSLDLDAIEALLSEVSDIGAGHDGTHNKEHERATNDRTVSRLRRPRWSL